MALQVLGDQHNALREEYSTMRLEYVLASNQRRIEKKRSEDGKEAEDEDKTEELVKEIRDLQCKLKEKEDNDKTEELVKENLDLQCKLEEKEDKEKTDELVRENLDLRCKLKEQATQHKEEWAAKEHHHSTQHVAAQNEVIELKAKVAAA